MNAKPLQPTCPVCGTPDGDGQWVEHSRNGHRLTWIAASKRLKVNCRRCGFHWYVKPLNAE